MSKQAVTEVTFEDGYQELKQLVADVDSENITVHEMCEKFARGKGLEQALRSYLDEQEGKLKEIEEGSGVPEFRVIAPAKPKATEEVVETPAAGSPAGSEDDIPF